MGALIDNGFERSITKELYSDEEISIEIRTLHEWYIGYHGGEVKNPTYSWHAYRVGTEVSPSGLVVGKVFSSKRACIADVIKSIEDWRREHKN